MVSPIESSVAHREDSKEERSDRLQAALGDRTSSTGVSISPNTMPRADGAASELRLYVGQRIDVLDSVNRWSEAEVLEVDLARRRVFVSYVHWSRKWDEWVSMSDHRLATLHTHTYFTGGELRVGQRLEVQDPLRNVLEAYVIDEAPTQVLVHYKDFGSKYDEWIPRQSPRISPFGSTKGRDKQRLLHQFKVPDVELVESKTGLGEERKRQVAEISERYGRYISALSSHGLRISKVEGDGNCLFRSVSHQIYGDDRFHGLIREKCMDYMEGEAGFFSQFVEGGLERFSLYLAAKRLNACWGDDPEIQALSEIYGRPIEIWASDGDAGARKLRTFHESALFKSRPHIRLSYYGGGHYDSLVSADQRVLDTAPGVVEDVSLQGQRASATASSKPGDESLAVALQESRAELERWGDADLENCLSMSLRGQGMDVKQGDVVVDDAAAVEAAELLGAQGQLIEAAEAESEREFIEQALQEALVGDSEDRALELALQMSVQSMPVQTSQDEELLLREAIAASMAPYAWEATSSGGAGVADEEEEIQRAIADSLKHFSHR